MRLIARLNKLEQQASSKTEGNIAERLRAARKRCTEPGYQPPEPAYTKTELEAMVSKPGLLGRLARAYMRTGDYR